MFRHTILSAVAVVLVATAGFSAMTSVASAQKVGAAAPIDQETLAGPSKKSLTIRFTLASTSLDELNTMQWTMAANAVGRPVLSGNQYRLVNAVAEAGLTRQVRGIPANLGFLDKDSKEFNVMIKRKAGNGQVKYGDVVALRIKTYGWLRYKHQAAGINLSDDDNNPHYIWVVTGGKKGTPLNSGMPFALYNTVEKTEMVYCRRGAGINLGWHEKSDCDTFLGKVSTAVLGENGLFSREGLSGKLLQKLQDHLCEAAVTSVAAAVVGGTSGLGAAAVAAATAAGIKECSEL